MQQAISLFYLLFLLGAVIMALFVAYHIARYSLSKRSALWGNILFLSVFVFFLATNAILFNRIDWESLSFGLDPVYEQNVW